MNNRVKGSASRLTGRLLIFVWAALLLGATGAKAAPVKTLIQDTLYRADGSAAHGTVSLRWRGFSTSAGEAVAAGEMTVVTDANGGISISLIPNTGSAPSGSYYKVVIKLDDGTTSEEQWVVPATASTTVAAIRSNLVPQAVATQFVSRDYVDSALGTLTANPVVHLSGAESIAGTKTFVLSPEVPAPTDAGGVANKGYVDHANTSGNAATATALAGVPAQCDAGQYSTGINASGVANCAAVAYSQIAGPPPIPNLVSPGAIGATTPSTGAFTNVTTSGSVAVGTTVLDPIAGISGPNAALSGTLSVGVACPVGTPAGTVCAGNILATNTAVVDVRTFGAKGDGITDNSAALQAAFARIAGSAQQTCLYFPKGSYNYLTALVWNNQKTLCMRGDTYRDSYLLYQGAAVVDSGLFVEFNGGFSSFDFNNMGFASNGNARYAFHSIRTGGSDMGNVAFAGGSVSSFQGDFFNGQRDLRNIVAGSNGFQPAGASVCVNGLTFDKGPLTHNGTDYFPSGQFTITSPSVMGCTGTGLNLANASAIRVNGGQISGNHQQLYENCTAGCNATGNIFNAVLFETSAQNSPIPDESHSGASVYLSVLTNGLKIFGSRTVIDSSQGWFYVQPGALATKFRNTYINHVSTNLGTGTQGFGNTDEWGNSFWNLESATDNQSQDAGAGSCSIAPVRLQVSAKNYASGTIMNLGPSMNINGGSWRGRVCTNAIGVTASCTEFTNAAPTMAVANGTVTFANNTVTGFMTATPTLTSGTFSWDGWVEMYPGSTCGYGLPTYAQQYASPILVGSTTPTIVHPTTGVSTPAVSTAALSVGSGGQVTTAGTAIAAGVCQAQSGLTVTGTTTASVVAWAIPNAIPATWQNIQIVPVVSANTVTLNLCNDTAASITPAAQAVNVRVIN